MKRIVIDDWQKYGDYMFFAHLVDGTAKWIMLETQGSRITATGKEDAIERFKELLTISNVKFIQL